MRDLVARRFGDKIGRDRAYKLLNLKDFDALFERVKCYPNHVDHTIDKLLLRVKKHLRCRKKAKESEEKYVEDPESEKIRRTAKWYHIRKGDYFVSRYEELEAAIKEAGIYISIVGLQSRDVRTLH